MEVQDKEYVPSITKDHTDSLPVHVLLDSEVGIVIFMMAALPIAKSILYFLHSAIYVLYLPLSLPSIDAYMAKELFI